MGLAQRPRVTRIEPLWQLLDQHFPGERTDERAFAIDDLYIDLIDTFDLDHDDDEWD